MCRDHAQVAGLELSSAVSLGVIVSTLGGGVLLSLAADAGEEDALAPHTPPSQLGKLVATLRDSVFPATAASRSGEDQSND